MLEESSTTTTTTSISPQSVTSKSSMRKAFELILEGSEHLWKWNSLRRSTWQDIASALSKKRKIIDVIDHGFFFQYQNQTDDSLYYLKV